MLPNNKVGITEFFSMESAARPSFEQTWFRNTQQCWYFLKTWQKYLGEIKVKKRHLFNQKSEDRHFQNASLYALKSQISFIFSHSTSQKRIKNTQDF